MKLDHRGISYEHNPAEIAMGEGKIGGKFRGRNWRVHDLKNAPIVKHFPNLIYRGAPVD